MVLTFTGTDKSRHSVWIQAWVTMHKWSISMNCLSKPFTNYPTAKLNACKTGRKRKSYLSKRAISYKELPALTNLQYKHALKLLHVRLQRNKTVITVGISFFQWLLSWKLGRFTFRKNLKCDFPDKPKILCVALCGKFTCLFQVAWHSLNFNGLWKPVSRSDQNKPRHLDNIERIMTPLKTTEWEKNNRNFAKNKSINRNKDI